MADYSAALYDAIGAMPDVLFVASAGNLGNDTGLIPRYPGSFNLPNIITVASSSPENTLSTFSNRNRYLVHVAAPGEGIVSTVSGALGSPGETYRALSGTSQATPHVSGLAALLKAQDSSRDWKTIKNLILSSGDPLPTLYGTTLSGRRINAERALSCTDAPLFSLLDAPRALTAGVPQRFRALSVNCGLPAGPVQMDISGIGSIALHDDGFDGDQFAGDGVFSVNWSPPDDMVRAIAITSMSGSATFQSKPMSFLAPIDLVANLTIDYLQKAIIAPDNADISLRMNVSGGQSPFIWVVSQGILPAGLLLDPSTGVISGTPTQNGLFDVTLQVTDDFGFSVEETWQLNVAPGLRDGWPKTLQLRSVTQDSYPPVFADLDGDGKQEIVVADGTFIYVYGDSGLLSSRNMGYMVSAPAIGDVDGDGQLEIIISLSDDTYSEAVIPVRVLKKDLTSAVFFTPPAADYAGMLMTGKSPVLADLDGDGTLEIIATIHDRFSSKIYIYTVTANGSLRTGWPVIAEASFNGNNRFRMPTVGDFDLDGTQEILYPDDAGNVHVYKPDGSPALIDYTANGQIGYSWSTSLTTPRLHDINNDGSPELILNMAALGGSSYFIVLPQSAYEMDYLYGNRGPRSIGSGNPEGYVVADLDGDGQSELIYYENVGSQLLLSAIKPDGTSLPGWPVIIHPDLVMPPGLNQPVVADIDGDGSPEVLFNLSHYTETAKGKIYTSPYIAAFHSTGLPVQGFPKLLMQSPVKTAAAIGDIDGNGKPDIAVKSEDGRLYVFEQSMASSLASAEWPMYAGSSSLTSSRPPRITADSITINPTAPRVSISDVTLTGKRPTGVDVTITNFATGGTYSPNYPTETTWSVLVGLIDGPNGIRAEGSNNYKTAIMITLIQADTEQPVVTSFTLESTSTSLTVPVTTFAASDNIAVTHYKITPTPGAPLATDSGWSIIAQNEFTFTTPGLVTAYAWVKDAFGNVSLASPEATAQVLITLPLPVNGSCGGAHGQSFAAAPSENLCTLGSATTVTSDMGLWKWSCNGLNNGSTATCSAAVLVTPGTPVQITSGSGNYPAINDIGEIVWVHADPVTFAEQVRSNVRGVVLDNGHNRANLAVNNLGDLVWTESVNGNGQIFSRINGVTTQVTSDPAVHDNPVITDSGEIFWNQWDATIQVYSNLRGALTADNTDHSYISVNNRGDMVWYQGAEGIGGMVAGSPFLIPTVTGYDPVINDQREIVWSDSNSSGNSRLFSNTRGELASTWRQDALYHYQPTINSCGDVAFLFYTNDNTGDGIYRLGDASPCGNEPEPNDTRQQASTIINGSVTVGTLSSAADAEDWYSFGASAGTPITLRINWDASGTNSLTVELRDSSDTVLASATGSGFGKTLTYTPSANGIYYLHFVSSAGTKFGYAVKTTFTSWIPPVEDGACGSSHGGTFGTTPVVNLCSTGSPSSVSGSGPWSWTCDGINGGTTATCSAALSAAIPVGATVVSYPAKPGSTFSVYRYEAGKAPELIYIGPLTSYTDTSSRLPNTIYRYSVSSDVEGATDVITIHTPLYNGWNIVGVPYDTTGIAASTVFNSPVSAVYEWIPTSNINPDNSGTYTPVATLTPGKGYFVKAGNSSTLMAYSGAVNPAGVNVVLKPGYTLISNTQTTNMTNIGTNWLIDGAPLATYINAIPPKIGGAVYWWNGINYDSWNILDLIPAMQPVIEPWKAYWLLNLDTINHTLTIQ